MCNLSISQRVLLIILCLGNSIIYRWENQRINLPQFHSYVYTESSIAVEVEHDVKHIHSCVQGTCSETHLPLTFYTNC